MAGSKAALITSRFQQDQIIKSNVPGLAEPELERDKQLDSIVIRHVPYTTSRALKSACLYNMRFTRPRTLTRGCFAKPALSSVLGRGFSVFVLQSCPSPAPASLIARRISSEPLAAQVGKNASSRIQDQSASCRRFWRQPCGRWPAACSAARPHHQQAWNSSGSGS
jgi:hypothetical protein